MTGEQKKLTVAVTFLTLAVFLLGFQVYRRMSGSSPSVASSTAPVPVMDEAIEAAAGSAVVYWQPPDAGVLTALTPNPFLTNGRVSVKAPRSAAPSAVAGAPSAGLTVRGIRTGQSRAAIINDRVVLEGGTVAGWRVLSIDTGRVTLRNSDGKTIRLAAK